MEVSLLKNLLAWMNENFNMDKNSFHLIKKKQFNLLLFNADMAALMKKVLEKGFSNVLNGVSIYLRRSSRLRKEINRRLRYQEKHF